MKRKRFVKILISSLLVLSMGTGCGKFGKVDHLMEQTYVSGYEEMQYNVDPDTPYPMSAARMDAPDPTGWDESKKIYAYCWDTDFESKLGLVLDKFPEYKDYVEIVVTGQGGTSYEYKTSIDTAFTAGSKYPSIVAADIDVAKLWSEDSEKTIALSEIGITEDMYANAYKFATEYGRYDGELKCMTWQACPGVFIYRSDIAEEVFGTSDPVEIQSHFDSWSNFFDSADKLKAAGYYVVSGYDDVKYAVLEAHKSRWVATVDRHETLILDNSISTYLDTAKKLYDEGYVDKSSTQWSSAWAANMSDDGKVFGYFGAPWFFNSMKNMGASNGKWNCCVGPVPFHWGGTYVMAGKNSSNPELQAFLIYELCCDASVAYDIAEKFGDCVNNKMANVKLKNNNVGSAVILNDQNQIDTLSDAILNIHLYNTSYVDSSIKEYIDEAARGYINGTFPTKSAALKYVRQQAQIELGLVTK